MFFFCPSRFSFSFYILYIFAPSFPILSFFPFYIYNVVDFFFLGFLSSSLPHLCFLSLEVQMFLLYFVNLFFISYHLCFFLSYLTEKFVYFSFRYLFSSWLLIFIVHFPNFFLLSVLTPILVLYFCSRSIHFSHFSPFILIFRPVGNFFFFSCFSVSYSCLSSSLHSFFVAFSFSNSLLSLFIFFLPNCFCYYSVCSS